MLNNSKLDNSKQWFLLILAATWLLAVLILVACAYVATQNAGVFSAAGLITPPIAMLRQLYRYYFPHSQVDDELQPLKIRSKHK